MPTGTTLARLRCCARKCPSPDVTSNGGRPAREARGDGRCPGDAPRRLRPRHRDGRQPRAAGQEGLLRHLRRRRPRRLRRVQQADPQAPGADRDLPHLGHRLPGLDRTLAGRAGAAGDAHLDRGQAGWPRADHPAGDRPRRRRRVPDPAQQALLGEGDARLPPAPRGAEPLPQRLGGLRLRGRTARRRPQPAPVHPRIPADPRDRPRRRQAQRDRHPPPQSRPAAAAEHRRRAAEGAGRGDLEHPAGGLADRPPKPPAVLLPRRRIRRLGRHRRLLRQPGLEGADPASTAATTRSPSRCPSSASSAPTTRPSSASC